MLRNKNDLYRRVGEHREKAIEGFASRFSLNRAVFYEEKRDPRDAIAREKQLEGWRREKKNRLIERTNPNWEDFAWDWFVHVPKTFDDAGSAAALPGADASSDPSTSLPSAQDDDDKEGCA